MLHLNDTTRKLTQHTTNHQSLYKLDSTFLYSKSSAFSGLSDKSMPGHRLQTSEKLKQSFITIQHTKTSSLCQLQLTAKEAFKTSKPNEVTLVTEFLPVQRSGPFFRLLVSL
ncbi:hypothetical protein HanXRQr2_Chr16g0755861 [Helianthus annuus]|uniref:Uncharacterized protein n=1 Tax=Helianthus annuus TaxID=4232 RepID=A0A9K3H0V2_HELAN|nr:hypothetical protein HanXRQr2_Chr16g0755861 [Helianthus annuus]